MNTLVLAPLQGAYLSPFSLGSLGHFGGRLIAAIYFYQSFLFFDFTMADFFPFAKQPLKLPPS
ncbi:MAG: hypothetical protein OEV92_00135 [Nitrospinota bacterium]|nr:hypothetical protein [Nitrospinota bacterium]